MEGGAVEVRDIEVLRSILGEVRAGEARAAGPLGLVPLSGGRPAPAYVLAEEALAAGLLEIREKAGGSVPTLVARNLASEPVLLLEGEQLVGVRQDRVLNVPVLVPASSELEIPVSCVEPRRWRYERRRTAFVDAPMVSPRVRARKVASVGASLRARGMRDSDQFRIWAAVEERLAEARVSSDTGALRHAYEGRAHDLAGIVAEAGEPAEGQTGVVACVGGRPIALDLFDRPSTLARVWPRLVRGYALDALGAEAAPVDGEAVRGFLAGLARGEATAHDAVGLGTEVVLSGAGLTGDALVWEGAVVQLAAFPSEPPRGRERPAGGQVGFGDLLAPPSSRSRRRRWADGPRCVR